MDCKNDNNVHDWSAKGKGIAKTTTVRPDGEQQFVGGLLSASEVITPSNESGRQGEYGGRSG